MSNSKTCTACKKEKGLQFFGKKASNIDGIRNQCKDCEKEYRDSVKHRKALYDKIYNESNKKAILEKSKDYYENNKEQILQKQREYYSNNKTTVIQRNKKYNKTKLKTDSLFRFKHNTRVLIKDSFKRGTNQFRKDARTETILGCTIEEFRFHIENQFKEGMTFENYGLWHLDHIKPISLGTTKEEIKLLNHYTNFQPLWAEENLKKSNKY
jgi:hypothetical protein